MIGRWLSRDPENQYWSPYVGMGNNPINLEDPTGGVACPNGDCGDMDVLLANRIVTTYFDPSENQKDIAFQLMAEVEALYEPGTVEFDAFASLVADTWSSIVYLDVVNPSLSELYFEEIGNAPTVGDAIDLIYSRTDEVIGRQKTFALMGLILQAYGSSAAGAMSSGTNVGTAPWRYRGQLTHSFARGVDRGVTKSMIDDAIAKPLKVHSAKTDIYGRVSQKIVGKQATIIVNPQTGRHITTWRTGSSTVRKLTRGQ